MTKVEWELTEIRSMLSDLEDRTYMIVVALPEKNGKLGAEVFSNANGLHFVGFCHTVSQWLADQLLRYVLDSDYDAGMYMPHLYRSGNGRERALQLALASTGCSYFVYMFGPEDLQTSMVIRPESNVSPHLSKPYAVFQHAVWSQCMDEINKKK